MSVRAKQSWFGRAALAAAVLATAGLASVAIPRPAAAQYAYPYAYPAAAYARLRGLKRRYDPDNVFRSNHNILPA